MRMIQTRLFFLNGTTKQDNGALVIVGKTMFGSYWLKTKWLRANTQSSRSMIY